MVFFSRAFFFFFFFFFQAFFVRLLGGSWRDPINLWRGPVWGPRRLILSEREGGARAGPPAFLDQNHGCQVSKGP